MKKIIRRIERIFWWASGAKIDILEKLPTEHSKYTGIGGTIIFTALMASFAGGYAFFTAFKDIALSIFFGLFWGSLIFNLDRYIVSTFGVGDGKKTISRQELIEASPRLIMAILLGFVIATPLELKLFEKEINAQISQEIAVVDSTIIHIGLNDPIQKGYISRIKHLNSNIEKRRKIIDEKYDTWQKATKDKNDEWNLGKFSGIRGKGGYYNDLKKIADNAEIEYTRIKKEYSDLNKKDLIEITKLTKKLNEREKENRSEIENKRTIQAQNDGLMARLKALNHLTKDNPSLLFTRWLITLLFIFIEIAPMLFKMMMEEGPYDYTINKIKHDIKVRRLQEISNINENINFDLRIHSEKNQQRLTQELEANKELLETIAKAQVEIAKAAIEEWKKEKIQEAKEDASRIIKSE
jgi:hypothetical protein